MINTSAGGYYVNGTTTKVKKLTEDVAGSEQGCHSNCTSPKDVPKEYTYMNPSKLPGFRPFSL